MVGGDARAFRQAETPQLLQSVLCLAGSAVRQIGEVLCGGGFHAVQQA